MIDFDIAMQVKDEDEEVDDQCGTKHWMAPEVKKKSSTYSPIKADRWSCGRVLLYLLDELRKEDKLLRAILRKLIYRGITLPSLHLSSPLRRFPTHRASTHRPPITPIFSTPMG
jgi:serine/threonine protein kinase